MPEEKTRYYLIDAVRGGAVLSMAAFHFCYDVFMIYGRDPGWNEVPAVRLWQQSICWTFILVSGYVWRWGGKGNLRRGLLCNLFGLLISLVTALAVPSEAIWFGILNFLGCAILLMIPLDKALRRVPPVPGLLLAALLFVFCRQVTAGFVGLGERWRVQVPGAFYSLKLLTPFGFPYPGFRSSDYFPLLPWLFLYLCGYFLHPLLQRSAVWRSLARRKVEPFTWIGQRSIWIYLIHQPLCMAVCWLLFR